MKTTVRKLSNSQIELRISIPAEEFKSFIRKAVLSLGKDLEIEGFRKGKAPPEIIEKKISQEKILKVAAEEAIQENYSKAISENKIETLTQPKIEILKLAKGNPFEFKAKTWLMPEVKLPDYKKIVSQIEKREIKVTEEEIEKLKQEKELREKERLRQEILEKIAKNSEVEVPEILIEEEKGRMLENLKRGVSQMLQISFKDYLTKLKKTEKEMLDSFGPEAQRRVKNSLVLREIKKKEEVPVTEQEIEEELKKISGESLNAEKKFDLERLKDYTKEVIKNEKTFQLLESLIKK